VEFDLRPLIVGFGEALIDKLPSGDVVGGAPLNFSLRAAELGDHFECNAAIVTRIRADQHGRLISARLSDSNLELSGVQIDEHLPTGFVDVVLDNGQPNYTIGRQVAWDAIEFDETASKLAQRAAVVCYGTLVQLGGISAQTLHRFLNAANSATKILDLNLRKPLPTMAIINTSLQQADVLKCNLEELQQLAKWFSLSHPEDGKAIAEQLQVRFDLQAVFWTRGAQGCCWQSGVNCVVAEVPKFDPEPNADSVGAGDAAGAALALGLVLGWKPERIVRSANLCGSFAASRRGATSPLSDEVLKQV
jgi:fructokinase